jgi:predicted amidophosphoribosyltransferase
MFGCHACGVIGTGTLCRACVIELAPGPGAWLRPGLVAVAGLTHSGPARRLVHRLKYDGVLDVASVLAMFMEPLLPRSAELLVPIPRATARRLRYGVDPARALAAALSRRSGLPVVDALTPGWWWRRRAGSLDRARPVLRATRRLRSGVVLVDDVLTSGATMCAAFATLGLSEARGVTATAPVTLSVQTSRRRHGAGEFA